VSKIDYRKLRKAQSELQRKGSFPFPSYAQALFSQVLISRRPIENAFGNVTPAKPKTPVATRGPQVAPSKVETPEENAIKGEKKSLLQSFGRFVSDSADEESKVSFKGGEVRAKSSGSDLVLKEEELISSVKPRLVDEITKNTKVIFLGECPKDYSQEAPHDNLLSKMIAAMKLSQEQYCRVFITKDSEVSHQEWLGLLKDLPSECKDLVVVTLGALATNTVLQKKERLSRIHGKEFTLSLLGSSHETTLRVFPVFHPDILQINPNMKRSAWLDLQKVMEVLG
jgi:DNA polymerase